VVVEGERKMWVDHNIVPKLREILSSMDRCVSKCHSIRIGLEQVPIDRFSSSCGSEDIGFLVLDDETDEREGSETFFRIEMTRMEGEEGEGIDIRMDPWITWMELPFFCVTLFWWSWNKFR
jgi:hypothetical protein